jgi:hypothetical protein
MEVWVMRLRLAVVLPLLVVASGAIWVVGPQGAAQQAIACTLASPQPEHPLEMNSVVSDPRTSQFRDPLIKHVIMEKEIYDCVRDPGTPDTRPFIRDVETFIEIIQRVQAGRTVPVEKRVEQVVCDKGSPRGGFFGITCSTTDVPLEQAPDFDCPRALPAITDPTEMNTVITSRQDVIKTFKVDKEIFDCGPRGHLYLFTEIVEGRVGGAADTIRPTEKKFQAILCLVDEPIARIRRCHHFIPGSVNG